MAGKESDGLHLRHAMRKLIEELQGEGLNGIYFPYATLYPHSDFDYALAYSFYPDVESDYFNYDECRRDFVDLVEGRFKRDGLVLIVDGFNNVEVYREGYAGACQ